MITAPAYLVGSGGRLARNRHQPAALVEARNAREQAACVGMSRVPQHFPGRPAFDNLSQIHDADRIGQADERRQIVCDQADGTVVVGEASYGRLYFPSCRGIKRCGGFVEQQDARVVDDRLGDQYSLALAARQLAWPAIRIVTHEFFREARPFAWLRRPDLSRAVPAPRAASSTVARAVISGLSPDRTSWGT